MQAIVSPRFARPMRRDVLTSRARSRAAWPWWLLGIAALAVGVFLRVWQLRSQMLLDDEWHAVRMLIRADMDGIADHFGLADYCIPLTLCYRWLYEHAALSEWAMHLPLLVAGIALLVVAPWLLRRSLPIATNATWVALLAVSPLLVYFSRTARPYALLALCGVIAFVAFRNWYERRGRGIAWAVAYVVATCFAGWAHLLSLVFTLWPLACAGVLASVGCVSPRTRADAWPMLRRLLLLGVVVAGVLVCLIAPPLINDWGAMAGKAGADSVSWTSLYQTLLMQFGIADAWTLAALLALGAIGVARVWRDERFLVGSVLSATIVGMAVIALARPAWVQHALVYARYATPVLPFLLLFVAAGIVAVVERVRVPAVAASLCVLAIGLIVMRGPLPSWFYAPNQFMGHALFQFDYDARTNPYVTQLELGPVSPFFAELEKKPPGSVTLIETPTRAQSNFVPDPWLQRIHRQNVKFALAAPVCGVGDWDEFPYTATGTRFARIGKLGDILDGATWGADYLVLRMHPWTLPPGKDFPWPVAWPDMAACEAKVEAKLGAPFYRDDAITVFALKPAR